MPTHGNDDTSKIIRMHREFMSNMAIATHLYDNAVRSPYGSQSWYDAGQIRSNGGDGSAS